MLEILKQKMNESLKNMLKHKKAGEKSVQKSGSEKFRNLKKNFRDNSYEENIRYRRLNLRH